MNNHQILMYILRAVKDRNVAWRVVDLVWGLLDGFVTREETEAELTGLVADPAALLEEIGKGTDGTVL